VNITVRARTPEMIDDAIEETRQVLRRHRGVRPNEEDNFEFFNSESLITEFNTMTLKIKIAAFVIGIIALVVAGIGIMNIMLVSVTERTREIGIRLAVGARPRDILTQFLTEAVILSLVGALAGIALGVGSSLALGHFAGWQVMLQPVAIVVAVASATAVGVFFGWYPARKASRMLPIQALRYE
jgi:putative ABC transport system permease protein